jgi:deoxyhypusine synthase
MANGGYFNRKRTVPKHISPGISLPGLIDGVFHASSAADLRACCHLFTRKMLREDVTVGIFISAAVASAGLDRSALIPLMEVGFIDWIISDGPIADPEGPFWIVGHAREFQHNVSTADFNYFCGRHAARREQETGSRRKSFLAAAYEAGVPVYTSDTTQVRNLAAYTGQKGFLPDVNTDIREIAALILNSRRDGGKSALGVFGGGGTAKDFLRQTEAQTREITRMEQGPYDYLLQVTDYAPDAQRTADAGPGQANPARLDTVHCCLDSTVALPVIAAYALDDHPPRRQKRLFEQRAEAMERIGESGPVTHTMAQYAPAWAKVPPEMESLESRVFRIMERRMRNGDIALF